MIDEYYFNCESRALTDEAFDAFALALAKVRCTLPAQLTDVQAVEVEDGMTVYATDKATGERHQPF